MNIHDLPEEILVKILVEGNFLSISRVCQTWRDHAQRKKSRFDVIFFDLTKDDPEKIEKKNLNQLFVFNSPAIDKNGFQVGPEIVNCYNYVYEYCSYLRYKYRKIFDGDLFVNTINFIYDPLLYISLDKSPEHSKKYILLNNICGNKYKKIIGIINRFTSNMLEYLYFTANKIKNVNIVIKDICDRIENIDTDTIFLTEIKEIKDMIHYRTFEHFEKLTFKAPNNTYLIYDKNKKLLIIRFGNYEKYNFPMEKTSICLKNCKYLNECININHKRYYIYGFKCNCIIFFYNIYPASLVQYDYEKMTKNIEKLIIISSEFYDFMFDLLLDLSKKDKKIEYHCLDSSKKKFEQENFEFVPVEKEKEQEYTFEQMHFKHFGENAF